MASFIALQDNGNSYVASKLRNRITVPSSGSSHKSQYILLMELKIIKNYSGYQSIWSMVDAENNACGTLAIKIRNGSPITSFPSATTEISWLNLKKGSSTQSPPILIATKEEFDIDTDNPYIIIKLYFQPNRTFFTAIFSIIQENYSCQILQKIAYPTEASYADNYQGTLLCTSNVITDNYNTYTNADSATKLYTARAIGITGGATGTATSFDGSKNINIPITSISPNYLGEGYTTKRFMLQTSAEAAGVVIPYLYNDLAHLLKKGGSVDVYYDNTLASTNLISAFNDGFTYWSKNVSGLNSITIEITLHTTFTYTNVFWIDCTSKTYRAKNIKVEIMNSNTALYPNDVWATKANITNHSESGYYLQLSHTPVGADNAGGGFNKIRVTFSNFNSATFRLGNIGLLARNGNGIGEVCLSRGGADMYGSITCFKDKTYNLGSTDKRWNYIYTHNINGLPSGRYLALRNYLDNSNFLNPVNSKGSTSYTGVTYTIDRWKANRDYSKLTITNEGVEFANTLAETETDYATFNQYLEDSVYNILKGKDITLIAEDTFGNKKHLTCQLPVEKPAAGTEIVGSSSTNFRITIGISPSNFLFVSIQIPPGKSQKFRNVALYEGKYDLASIYPTYHPKEYSQELLECQRYMYWIKSINTATQHIGMGISSNSTTTYAGIKLPTSMRIQPTIYFENLEIWDGANHVNVTGVEYYTISQQKDFCTLKITTGSSLTAKQSAILSTRALSDTITNSYILFDANLY